MNLTDFCLQGSEDIWEKYLSPPFITEMADGSLPIEKYRKYMLVDYAYLREYVKLVETALEKPLEPEEEAFLKKHISGTSTEMDRTHLLYLQSLGISTEEVFSVTLPPIAREYMDYMTDIVRNGGFFDCITVLLSCSWSYNYIAEKVVEKKPDAVNAPVYGGWFSSYECEGYYQGNQELIDRVNSYAERIPKERWQHYADVFRVCSEYELKFWDMLYE